MKESIKDCSGRGSTIHYELRIDGYYAVWGVDFPQDSPGCRKLEVDEVTDLVKSIAVDCRN